MKNDTKMETKKFNIQPGDVLYWKGFNREVRGEVIRDKDGTLTVMTSADKGFAVKDVINSWGLRIERNGVVLR